MASMRHRGSQFALGYDWWKTGPSPNHGTSEPDLSVNHTSSALLLRDAAVDFVHRAATRPQPWFLYLPFQRARSLLADEHYRDLHAPQRFTEDERTLFGYITEMDDAVGAVVEAMNASGCQSNSITIFSSDNGAPGNPVGALHKQGKNPGYIARNHPHRAYSHQFRHFQSMSIVCLHVRQCGHFLITDGTGCTVFVVKLPHVSTERIDARPVSRCRWDQGARVEGGTRVPGFVYSPLLPPTVRGTTSNALFHVTDWLPTIVAIAGGNTSRNLPLDGLNI